MVNGGNGMDCDSDINSIEVVTRQNQTTVNRFPLFPITEQMRMSPQGVISLYGCQCAQTNEGGAAL